MSLKQKFNAQINREIYKLNGQAATLNGEDVFPIIESNADQEEGAPFVALDTITFTARFNAFDVIEENLKIAQGQTLVLAAPFQGFSDFLVTTDPIPTGRKGTQFIVSIAPSSESTIGQSESTD